VASRAPEQIAFEGKQAGRQSLGRLEHHRHGRSEGGTAFVECETSFAGLPDRRAASCEQGAHGVFGCRPQDDLLASFSVA